MASAKIQSENKKGFRTIDCKLFTFDKIFYEMFIDFGESSWHNDKVILDMTSVL